MTATPMQRALKRPNLDQDSPDEDQRGWNWRKQGNRKRRLPGLRSKQGQELNSSRAPNRYV